MSTLAGRPATAPRSRRATRPGPGGALLAEGVLCADWHRADDLAQAAFVRVAAPPRCSS